MEHFPNSPVDVPLIIESLARENCFSNIPGRSRKGGASSEVAIARRSGPERVYLRLGEPGGIHCYSKKSGSPPPPRPLLSRRGRLPIGEARLYRNPESVGARASPRASPFRSAGRGDRSGATLRGKIPRRTVIPE